MANEMSNEPLCVFGEVLFDRFPGGESVLGGAPFNVAWHLTAFGEAPLFLSAVGDDEAGGAIRAAMVDWGMDTRGLHTDPDHPTGEVRVSLAGGEPSYEIVPDRAYDHIVPPPGTAACGLLYHGTLALRSPASAAALAAIKAQRARALFLDVNLRDPWWDREQVLALVADATWVKLNADELDLLAPPGGPGPETESERLARAAVFRDEQGLEGLILTLGARGAVALSAGEGAVTVEPPPRLPVVDAVGAGDAFASVCILGLRRNWPVADTLERAQTFAARIVGQRGAIAADPGLYAPFVDQWGLAPD
jgi:fructokinase